MNWIVKRWQERHKNGEGNGNFPLMDEMCVNCKRPFGGHENEKCIFGGTTFEDDDFVRIVEDTREKEGEG